MINDFEEEVLLLLAPYARDCAIFFGQPTSATQENSIPKRFSSLCNTGRSKVTNIPYVRCTTTADWEKGNSNNKHSVV